MRTKILAAVAAVSIALGIVAFTATSASAHHNVIDPTVACDATPGQWVVTWSVTNSMNELAENIFSSNHTDIVPIGTGFTGGETKTFTQTVTTPTDITLTIGGYWPSDGYSTTNSKLLKASAFSDDCVAPPTSVTASASATNASCVVGAISQGYLTVVVTTGVNYTITKKGDSALIPFNALSGKTGPLATGDYTVTAAAAKGYTLANAKDWPKTLTVESAGDCTPPCLPASAVSYTYNSTTNSGSITVTAAQGFTSQLCAPFWVTAASWTYDGNTSWPQTLDEWNPANGGIKIDSVGNYPYGAGLHCGQGDIYATFTSPGVTKPSTAQGTLQGPSNGYSEHFLHQMGFSGSTPTYTTQNPSGCGPVVVNVVPAATFTDVCGSANDGIVGATDTAEIDYTVTDGRDSNGVGLVSVSAAPQSGYKFMTDAYTGPWSHTFTNIACPIVVNEVPQVTFTDVCGTANDLIVGATDTAGIDYTITDSRDGTGVGLVSVSAAPQAGYVFSNAVFAGPWTHSFTSDDCTVIPGDPTVMDQKCSTVQENTTVSGYIWVDYSGDLKNEVKYQIAGGIYDFTAAQEINNLPPGTYTVTASALTGYQLDTTKKSKWTLTIASAGTCNLVTHPLVTPTASSHNLTCSSQGSYTLVKTTGVEWFVNGSPTATNAGTYMVKNPTTINVEAGLVNTTDYGWNDNVQTTWTFTFTSPTGCLPTLAYTGASGGYLGLLLSGGFLLLGGAIIVVERRLRGNSV